MPVDVRNLAVTVIAVLAVTLVLQLMESVLIPIVLGILISYALSPIVKGLTRVYVPRVLAAFLAVSLLVGALGACVWAFSDDAMAVVRDVPTTAQRIAAMMRAERNKPADSALEQYRKPRRKSTRPSSKAPSRHRSPRACSRWKSSNPAFGRPTICGWRGRPAWLRWTVRHHPLSRLLSARDRRSLQAQAGKDRGPTLTKKKVTVQILDEINRQIENFIKVQVLTSLIVGVATGAALWWFDVEHFVIWGMLAGIFNSVPYLGPIFVSGSLGVVAFMQFGDIGRAATVAATAMAITEPGRFRAHPRADGPRRTDEPASRSSSASCSGAGSGAYGERSSPCPCS